MNDSLTFEEAIASDANGFSSSDSLLHRYRCNYNDFNVNSLKNIVKHH